MISYIGITDFTSRAEIVAMKSVLASVGGRQLHAGVMMSYKTLHGIPSRFTNVFPPKESLKDIFGVEGVLNCLHYADYDNNPDLDKSLVSALNFGGPGLNALQLDMVWPDPESIRTALRSIDRKIEVILQVSKNALEQVGNDPTRLIEKLASYHGAIGAVLLDKSMGRGLTLDPNELMPFAKAIVEHFPELHLAVAGGLGPDTLDVLAPLIKEFPNLSIDAQSRLRPSHNAIDPVNWKMAEKYLLGAAKLFQQLSSDF